MSARPKATSSTGQGSGQKVIPRQKKMQICISRHSQEEQDAKSTPPALRAVVYAAPACLHTIVNCCNTRVVYINEKKGTPTRTAKKCKGRRVCVEIKATHKNVTRTRTTYTQLSSARHQAYTGRNTQCLANIEEERAVSYNHHTRDAHTHKTYIRSIESKVGDPPIDLV